ncbi:MAG: peptidase C69 family protein, partial [Planctomycetota bacterium]
LSCAWPPSHPLPFAVTPSKKITVQAVAAILRNRDGPIPICNPFVQEAAIYQLHIREPREIGCVVWRTTAEPSTSVFLPWFLGITEAPKSMSQDLDLETHLSLKHHFNPPRGTFNKDLTLDWWAFKTLQDTVHQRYNTRIETVRTAWAAFEERLFKKQKGLEGKARLKWKSSRKAARAFLTETCAQLAKEARQEAERLCGEISAKK